VNIVAEVNIVVLAKAPRPGYVKTRLCPPCTPEEAAMLAAAALTDTLDAVLATPAGRHVLVLDGAIPSPAGFEVFPQRGSGLAQRLAHAFADVGGPALLIGMDTPQVTPALLTAAVDLMAGADAVLGLASDGGWWAIGLTRPDAHVFLGVPMSTDETGARQAERLQARGLTCVELPVLTDVDDITSARAVAGLAPSSRFAAAMSAL